MAGCVKLVRGKNCRQTAVYGVLRDGGTSKQRITRPDD
jgi:hypothetical protein